MILILIKYFVIPMVLVVTTYHIITVGQNVELNNRYNQYQTRILGKIYCERHNVKSCPDAVESIKTDVEPKKIIFYK